MEDLHSPASSRPLGTPRTARIKTGSVTAWPVSPSVSARLEVEVQRLKESLSKPETRQSDRETVAHTAQDEMKPKPGSLRQYLLSDSELKTLLESNPPKTVKPQQTLPPGARRVLCGSGIDRPAHPRRRFARGPNVGVKLDGSLEQSSPVPQAACNAYSYPYPYPYPYPSPSTQQDSTTDYQSPLSTIQQHGYGAYRLPLIPAQPYSYDMYQSSSSVTLPTKEIQALESTLSYLVSQLQLRQAESRQILDLAACNMAISESRAASLEVSNLELRRKVDTSVHELDVLATRISEIEKRLEDMDSESHSAEQRKVLTRELQGDINDWRSSHNSVIRVLTEQQSPTSSGIPQYSISCTEAPFVTDENRQELSSSDRTQTAGLRQDELHSKQGQCAVRNL